MYVFSFGDRMISTSQVPSPGPYVPSTPRLLRSSRNNYVDSPMAIVPDILINEWEENYSQRVTVDPSPVCKLVGYILKLYKKRQFI